MDENLHNIENLFRDGLEDNAEMPSLNVWNGIDNILDKDNVVSFKKKYTAMKRIAILLLLIVLGFSIYELSTSHNNGAMANGNENSSNSETISKSNNTETASTYTNKSLNPADSLVIAKSTSTNNPQIHAENDSTIGNKITSDNILASSKKNNDYKQNTSVDNSIVDKSMLNNKFKLNGKIKPVKKDKEIIGNNSIVDNISFIKTKQRFSDKALYKVKVNSPNTTEDYFQTTTNNDPTNANLHRNSLQWPFGVTIDKKIQDSADAKKPLQSIATNKIVSPNGTESVVTSNAKKKVGKSSGFSIMPFFSPDIAWYRLQEGKPDNQPDNLAKIAKSEKHEFSSTAGVLVEYRINKKWGLQSGLTYSNTNITVGPKTIYAQKDNSGNIKYRINTSSGYGYVLPSFNTNPSVGDSLYAFTSTHTLNYIGIPLALKYNITKKKFTFTISAGISANILTKGKIETTLEKGFNNEAEVVDNLQGLKKIYFSGSTGLGVDYKLRKNLSLSFTPTYKFALNSINTNAPVKSYPNSLGLVVGLKIGL